METDANGRAGPTGDLSSVAGLAREFEQLYRDVRELRGVSKRVDDLAATVAHLAETATLAKPKRPDTPAPCWIDHPTDPGRDPASSRTARGAELLLDVISRWIAAVYLRYSDARLPACWLWHPDVVEELLWLHEAWEAAYHPEAPATAVGDWHDRQRPGVVARIKTYAGMCSLEVHQPGHDGATPAPATPTADGVKAIAAWWTTQREDPGPAPTNEQMTAAAESRRTAGRSRR